jgi:hypothetical protein
MELKHPFGSGDFDPDNLMNYYIQGSTPPTALRFNQWRIINKLDKVFE